MAELIIQNPSITTDAFEYDEAGRVSAIAEHPLAGGGGGTIEKSDLMWKPNVGSDGYVRWTLASSATTPDEAYISGAQGPAGPQGEQGPSGAKGDTGEKGDKGDDATPITATTATIAGGTQVTISYTSGGDPLAQFNILSGAQGASGTNGKDGISPTVSTETITGGSRVIFTYDNGGTPATESIDVMSGASGAKGSDGFSPTVELTEIDDPDYPQGGWNVKITDAEHQAGQTFQIFNGINGQGATVDLIGGTGIQVSHQAGTTDYTISVSADYALKSYVDSASAYALSQAESWVENKHYLTSVPDTYALKSDVPTAVAQLSDSANYYTINQTSAASELTTEFAKYALLANIPTKVTDLTDSANYVVTGNILTGTGDTLTGIKIGSTSYTVPTTDLSNYYTKSQTSANSELDAEFANKVAKPDTTQTDLNNNYLIYSTLTGTGTTTGWMPLSANYYSKSEADGRYQKKEDMGNYLTTAQYETDSATFVTSSNSTITGTKQYALTTTGWASVETAYLPLTGGTVTGQTTICGSAFDIFELKRSDQQGSTGIIGINGAGGMSFKVVNGNNNTQLNIASNATMDKRFSIGDSPYSPSAYFIPAVTSTTTAGLTDDGILHIIVEN